MLNIKGKAKTQTDLYFILPFAIRQGQVVINTVNSSIFLVVPNMSPRE